MKQLETNFNKILANFSIFSSEIKPMIGTRILNYEIKSLIGEGGMGAVYMAEHLQKLKISFSKHHRVSKLLDSNYLYLSILATFL